MTVSDVIASLLDDLGIRKVVSQGSKSARVEYTLSVDEQGERFKTSNSAFRLTVEVHTSQFSRHPSRQSHNC